MLAIETASGFRSAIALCLAGTAGLIAELIRIRRLSQIKAADRPPAHERPRLLAARAEERRPNHVEAGSIAHPRA